MWENITSHVVKNPSLQYLEHARNVHLLLNLFNLLKETSNRSKLSEICSSNALHWLARVVLNFSTAAVSISSVDCTVSWEWSLVQTFPRLMKWWDPGSLSRFSRRSCTSFLLWARSSGLLSGAIKTLPYLSDRFKCLALLMFSFASSLDLKWT